MQKFLKNWDKSGNHCQVSSLDLKFWKVNQVTKLKENPKLITYKEYNCHTVLVPKIAAVAEN